MHRSRLRARYRYIMAFFARAVAGFIYWEIVLPRIGLRALARQTRSNRYKQLASRFRTMAIHMGGVMIKVGQFLSSRLDVLPVEITDELSGLQDEVQRRVLMPSANWPRPNWARASKTYSSASNRTRWLPPHSDRSIAPDCAPTPQKPKAFRML